MVLPPLGMSGVELVQHMVGEEEGMEQECTREEEVEAAVAAEVEEGEGEECCE